MIYKGINIHSDYQEYRDEILDIFLKHKIDISMPARDNNPEELIQEIYSSPYYVWPFRKPKNEVTTNLKGEKEYVEEKNVQEETRFGG